jgi:hypothetical protein
LLDVFKMSIHGHDPFILVKVRWFPQEAAVADPISQTVFLRTDLPWATKDSIIRAEEIESQVCIVPIPWLPKRLAITPSNRRRLPMGIRETPGILAVVLDRTVDFVGEVADDEDDHAA